MSEDEDQKRTLIKIGPKWADIGCVSITAGDAVRSKSHCECGAVLWVFTLYLWTPEGPVPIYTGPICEKVHPMPGDQEPTEKEPEE